MQSVNRGRSREAMRACPARLACLPRFAACLMLSVMLALVPLEAQISNWDGFGSLSNRDSVLSLQRNEANANPAAVAGVGAALSALALELGISESALMAGIAVSAAGATGLAVNMALDPQAPPAPGFKPWDDLTPEEKGIWGDYNAGTGEGGDIETYQKNAIGWWALQYGLLETGDNGGYEPTPEPDPEQDPDGNKFWNKKRNAILALSLGGSVAFNEAVLPFVDTMAGNLKSLLFGTGSDQLGLKYIASPEIDGFAVPFWYVEAPSYAANWTNGRLVKSSNIITLRTSSSSTLTINKGSTVWYVPENVSHAAASYDGNTNQWSTAGGYTNLLSLTDTTTQTGFLNCAYTGVYRFQRSANEYVTYSNGEWSEEVDMNADYGQMVDTPEGLSSSIINNNLYNNFVNNYTNGNDDGTKKAISVPAGISNPGYTPTYSDIVHDVPTGGITDIPDDGPLPNPLPDPDPDPDPDPNPNPDDDPIKPNPDWDYPDNIGDAIDNLGNAVFDQLFPFCLIGDIRRLCEKINPEPQNVRMLSVAADDPADATQYQFVLPLSDFNIDGVDDMTFEIGPVFNIAHMVRPWWTVLIATSLIAESIRYFLK